MPENDLPPIAYDELIERLSDPDSDLDHYMRYMIEVPIPGRMGPDVQPNPALVTGIPPQIEGGFVISLANGFMRRRRHRAYRRRIRGGWSGPRFVSEGDSWFQYPTSLQDIIDHLMKENAILSLGAAGDELEDIRRQREILLNIDAEGASALLISAGGNDLFDNGQLGRLIETPFPGASGADLVGPTFDAFLDGMVGQYLDLFRRVHRAFPKVHILIHGYGPAFPRGGAWIEKPLTKAGVPIATQHEVVTEILKRFNETLGALAARPEFHGRLVHIDVTDIGTDPGDWHDEIHLDGPNYKKVADRFQEVLDARMDAPEPEGMVFGAAPEVTQAVQLAALDQATLLRELDLRVRLIELDPTASDEGDLPLLFPDHPAPELGIATLRRATRKLIDRWLDDLSDVLCGGAEPDSFLERAIVEAFDKGREALAAAVSAWLVSGPFGVPAAIAGALAAWLAGEVLEAGKTALCAPWQAKSPPIAGAEIEAAVPTMGELRERMRKPDGLPSFDADFQKDELEMLREAIRREAVEVPDVPIDEHGAEAFMSWAAHILEMLGGDPDNAQPPDDAAASIEAFVAVDGTRPALYVRDDTIDLTAPPLERSGLKDRVTPALGDIERQIRATGRIIRGFDRSADKVYGSAWMLADGRVATAMHVFEFMSRPMGNARFLDGTYFVDFAVEADRAVRPDRVFRIEAPDFVSPDHIDGHVHPPHLDIATFRLVPNGLADFPDPIPLAAEDPALMAGERPLFFNVGHPGAPHGTWLVEEEDGNPRTLARHILHALIGDKFGVKRFSPGMVIARPGIFETMGGHAGSVFLHDATTLGGSSGSSLMMEGANGMVMAGLHFAGQFGTRNYAHYVPATSEALT
jgi:hypothetical protein